MGIYKNFCITQPKFQSCSKKKQTDQQTEQKDTLVREVLSGTTRLLYPLHGDLGLLKGLCCLCHPLFELSVWLHVQLQSADLCTQVAMNIHCQTFLFYLKGIKVIVKICHLRRVFSAILTRKARGSTRYTLLSKFQEIQIRIQMDPECSRAALQLNISAKAQWKKY